MTLTEVELVYAKRQKGLPHYNNETRKVKMNILTAGGPDTAK